MPGRKREQHIFPSICSRTGPSNRKQKNYESFLEDDGVQLFFSVNAGILLVKSLTLKYALNSWCCLLGNYFIFKT